MKLTSNLQKGNTLKLDKLDAQLQSLDVRSKGSITLTEAELSYVDDENASFKQYDQNFETLDMMKKKTTFAPE